MIVLKGLKIEAVGELGMVEIPRDAKSIDAERKSVMPGLIDVHFHFYASRALGIDAHKRYLTSIARAKTWAFACDKCYWIFAANVRWMTPLWSRIYGL